MVEAEGPRALVECGKIKGVRRLVLLACTLMWMYSGVLSLGRASNDISKKPGLKQFFRFHKTPRQNKTAATAGGQSESSLLDKGPVNHLRESGGWSKLKQGHNGSLGFQTHIHTHTPKECMANKKKTKKQHK